MRITPMDIEQQQFGRSFRGYNEEEVDNFLDRIAKDYEEILNENIKNKEELEKLQTRLEEYSRMEETLRSALVNAQQSASNIKESVQIEARALIEGAKIEAERIKQRAKQEILDINNEIAALKKNKYLILEKLKNTLKIHIRMLEDEIVEEPEKEIKSIYNKGASLESFNLNLYPEKEQSEGIEDNNIE
jgi:cell division initiation protein